jgi:hypothetical protein
VHKTLLVGFDVCPEEDWSVELSSGAMIVYTFCCVSPCLHNLLYFTQDPVKHKFFRVLSPPIS